MIAATEPSRARQNVFVGLIAISAVIGQFDRQSIAILKPALSGSLGWSDADYATIVAWYQGASAVALLFTGWIVDRISLRSAGAAASAGWSLAMVAHGWMRTVLEACVYRVGLGVFQALSLPAALRLISALLPPARRPMGFGIMNASVTLGGIVAPLVLPVMAGAWGWRGTMIGLGVAGLVWSAIWLLGFRDQAPHAAATGRTVTPEEGRAPGAILRDPRYRRIALAKALADLTWWLTLFWMPDFFHRQFGLSMADAGGPIALAYLLCASGALFAGAAVSRLIVSGHNRRRAHLTVLTVAIACVCALPMAAVVSDPWAAAGLLGLTLFGHQCFGTIGFAIIADQARPGELGRLTGLCAFCGNIGGTLIVKLAGVLLMAGAGFFPLFIVLPIAYVLALLLYARVLPREYD